MSDKGFAEKEPQPNERARFEKIKQDIRDAILRACPLDLKDQIRDALDEASEATNPVYANHRKATRMNEDRSFVGWQIQARVVKVDPNHPLIVKNGKSHWLLTTNWSTFQPDFDDNNPAGVPTGKRDDWPLFRYAKLLNRDAAVALAYTVVAQIDDAYLPVVEVRIVPFKVTHKIAICPEGESVLLEEHLSERQREYRNLIHKKTADNPTDMTTAEATA